ncbi:mitochondrial import inner membrane translocase subunit Tim29 [Adelges cooleyi]|uniref:mitochondrial import inner membrane translocase subunit Tim29 n=1 Tax=Adelges cooleyi TaxID=133065 RepID=UPI00217F8204|nr:mitochondrial import inner membrane translocase subunit Tim29 [Adelges cooleyi]
MFCSRQLIKWYGTLTSSSLKQKSGRFAFPERFRGTIVERWKTYWESVAKDYYESTLGVGTYIKENPIKSVLASTLGGCVYYCVSNNPDENSFRSELLECANSMLYISPTIRNPNTVQRLEYLEKCYNMGIVKRFDLLLFSVIWIDEFNNDIQLFKANCSYIKPTILQIPQRAIDIGFLGKWWHLKQIMVDYDINPDEWKNIEEQV